MKYSELKTFFSALQNIRSVPIMTCTIFFLHFSLLIHIDIFYFVARDLYWSALKTLTIKQSKTDRQQRNFNFTRNQFWNWFKAWLQTEAWFEQHAKTSASTRQRSSVIFGKSVHHPVHLGLPALSQSLIELHFKILQRFLLRSAKR